MNEDTKYLTEKLREATKEIRRLKGLINEIGTETNSYIRSGKRPPDRTEELRKLQSKICETVVNLREDILENTNDEVCWAFTDSTNFVEAYKGANLEFLPYDIAILQKKISKDEHFNEKLTALLYDKYIAELHERDTIKNIDDSVFIKALKDNDVFNIAKKNPIDEKLKGIRINDLFEQEGSEGKCFLSINIPAEYLEEALSIDYETIKNSPIFKNLSEQALPEVSSSNISRRKKSKSSNIDSDDMYVAPYDVMAENAAGMDNAKKSLPIILYNKMQDDLNFSEKALAYIYKNNIEPYIEIIDDEGKEPVFYSDIVSQMKSLMQTVKDMQRMPKYFLAPSTYKLPGVMIGKRDIYLEDYPYDDEIYDLTHLSLTEDDFNEILSMTDEDIEASGVRDYLEDIKKEADSLKEEEKTTQKTPEEIIRAQRETIITDEDEFEKDKDVDLFEGLEM